MNYPICHNCGISFKPTRQNQKYCSHNCYAISRKKLAQKECTYCGKIMIGIPKEIKKRKYCSYTCRNHAIFGLTEPIECGYCKKSFTPTSDNTKYCSDNCYRHDKYNQASISKPKICPICTKKFFTHKSDQMCCSRKCNGKFRSIKVIHTCKYCGKEFFDRPKANREYCSNKCKSFALRKSGPDNPMWKGGQIRYRGKNWKEQSNKARIRDNFTCQECGHYQVKPLLTVHHIKPYRDFYGDYKSANELDNLVTLCRSCHSKQKIR